MDSGTVGIVGVAVGAGVTLIASVVVPLLRDRIDRKRTARDLRLDRLSPVIRDIFAELTKTALGQGASDAEEFRERAIEQARLMMELHLLTTENEAAVSNVAMLAFTLVTKDPSQTPEVIGRIARVLPAWRIGMMSADEAFSEFIEGLTLDSEMLSALKIGE